jgi:hypothetical protein
VSLGRLSEVALVTSASAWSTGWLAFIALLVPYSVPLSVITLHLLQLKCMNLLASLASAFDFFLSPRIHPGPFANRSSSSAARLSGWRYVMTGIAHCFSLRCDSEGKSE